MSTKLQFYSEFAERMARQITGSYRSWTAFLATTARLYKYPYNEQLMIYAQRPNATACAEYDFWKDRMGRYVQRGSTGIALIDTSGYQPRLRYVFDVADTAPRDAARSFTLWEMRAEHEAKVCSMLTEQYDVPQDGGIIAQFERVADKLALEYWTEQKRDICGIVADSFLNGYDEDNIRMAFKTAASTSITYALMARCGFSPDGYFEPEDFMPVFDFNTPAAVSALGTAVSEISQRVLRQIEITVKRQERERRAERTEEHGEQPDLQDQRRISDPRPEPARESAEPAARQIRTDAPDVSQGASPDPLEPDDPDGNAVSAPAGDRRSGEPEVGADDAEPDEVGRRDGGAESSRPIEVDRSDEHLQGASRGSDPRGTDLRVTEPVQGEQISFMLEAENAQTSSASSLSIPSELIDHVLRLGGNSDDTRMVLAAAFQKEKSAEEITEILRQEFHGGNGFKLDGADYSAWYADDGIHLAAGREAERVEAAQIISWQDAAARVAQLVESGEYATNVEIAEAYKHERDLLAEALLHLRGDLSDDARKQGDLSCLQEYGGSFPKALEKLSEALKDPVFQQNLSDEYAAFWTAYELDKNLLRFHYHKLREIWHRLKDLRLPRYELSDGMTEVPSAVQFITEDEISHTLMRGSGFAEGKSRIYAYFTDTHTEKEQADFLKKEYGVGGRTHAVSGASSSYEGSEPKGITLRKADCADVEMRWNRVAARISDLIRQNRYLTPEERAAYDEALAQDTVRNTAYDGYNAVKEAHPDDIVLYQVGDFFELYGEDARAVADDLSLELTRRNLEGVGRVTMCGFPANELEKYVEKLREKHDVTISRILMTLENNDLRLDQAQALLSSPTPLADVFKEFENRETDYMDVVRDSMESRANTLLRWWKTPVYPHSGSYAREHEELEQYRASKRANIDCRDAIERAIADHYQHNVLSPEGAREVVRSFGFERTMFVLANTINVKSWDDRFGGDNREWAKTIPIEPDEGGGSDRRLDYVVDRSHSVLLDVFARQVRHEYLLTQPLTAVDIDNEALRICRQMSALAEPNSPSGTHFMVPLSPDFCARASSKDTAALQKRLPYPSLALTGMDGRKGVFAVVDQKEDRSRPPRKVRQRAPSVRDKLRKASPEKETGKPPKEPVQER